MLKELEILAEAEEWVKAINRHFGIKKKILVVPAKLKAGNFAVTLLSTNPTEPVTIEINVAYFKRKTTKYSLFEIVLHEMIHVLLWPITCGQNCGHDKKEETIVWALQSLIKKIAERGNKNENR